MSQFDSEDEMMYDSEEDIESQDNLDPLGNDEVTGTALVEKFLEAEFNVDSLQETLHGFSISGIKQEPGEQNLEFETSTVKNEEKDVKKRSSNRIQGCAKRPTKLPTALKGLMGEANLRYARGDKETAVKICLEIIRQVPSAPEPFQTLAGLYEEMGDRENSLLMSLIAAHLTPTDVYGWLHLADQSEEIGNIRQAISCCTKAIKLDITNMDLHKKRTALLEKIGDKKTAIRGYMQLLFSLDSSRGEYVVSVAKFVAEMCHKENDLEKACSALELAVEKCPKLIRFDFVNLHLELLILLKSYKRCLEIMVEFCDMVFEAETNDETAEESFQVIDCYFPDSTPVDILSKLAVVLIHMNSFHLLDRVVTPILALDASEVGELYLDIAEAYVEEDKHEDACMMYSVLVNSETYSLPGVWLKYAESLKILGKLEEAVEAYYNVLEGAQQHNNVKLTLASILVELGRQDEAVNVLYQHEDETVDTALLFERCKLLIEDDEKLMDLLSVAQVLFLRHSVKIDTRDELKAITVLIRHDKRRQTVKQMRQFRNDQVEFEDSLANKKKTPNAPNDPLLEEEWNLFLEVCNKCLKNKLYSKLQSFAVIAQLSNLFNPKYKPDIQILTAIAAYLNKDYFGAYNTVRGLVAKNLSNPKLWQLFNLIVNCSEDARHNRFVMRLLARNPDNFDLGILHGNNCLVSGTYKYALHEYSICYKMNPSPLCTLLLGLTYLQMAAQKFTSKKHSVVLQAVGFLSEYKNKRGKEGLQEAYYNLGRAFHHLGVFLTAIHYYKLALDCVPAFGEGAPHIFNLQREAAYNLHLIYLQSESYEMARMYINKYIVV